jgi:hypothetical protein
LGVIKKLLLTPHYYLSATSTGATAISVSVVANARADAGFAIHHIAIAGRTPKSKPKPIGTQIPAAMLIIAAKAKLLR